MLFSSVLAALELSNTTPIALDGESTRDQDIEAADAREYAADDRNLGDVDLIPK